VKSKTFPRTSGTRVGTLLGILLALSSAAASADSAATRAIPQNLELLVRSTLAMEGGNLNDAALWAEALSMKDPGSSFAASRYAQVLEAAGEDPQALQWGERALALDSLNADAAMLVGRMRLRAGEAGLAVKALTPALRMVGARPELYALRALAHELDKNYEAALADLKRTEELLPDFGWVATGVLGLALEDGRLTEASQALKLALDLSPNDSRTLGLGVELARRLGDTALEESLLRRAADLPDAGAEQVSAYASFLFREGDRKAQKAFLEGAARRGFDPGDIRVLAGGMLLTDGEYRAALDALRPIGDRKAALPIKGRALIGVAEEKEALRCFRKLDKMRNLTEEESLIVAYLQIRTGDRRDGVVRLERLRPGLLDSPRQVLAGSLCYVLLGHPEEAIAILREAADRAPDSPVLYAELGQTAAEAGDSLVAEWAFQKLHDLGGENSECLYFLAVSDVNQGATDRALGRLSRAVELDPTNGRALTLLGTLRFQMGQWELARDLLTRAVRCRDAGPDAPRALARVCRALRLDSEARSAEARARGKHASSSPAGLTLFAKP